MPLSLEEAAQQRAAQDKLAAQYVISKACEYIDRAMVNGENFKCYKELTWNHFIEYSGLYRKYSWQLYGILNSDLLWNIIVDIYKEKGVQLYREINDNHIRLGLWKLVVPMDEWIEISYSMLDIISK